MDVEFEDPTEWMNEFKHMDIAFHVVFVKNSSIFLKAF